MQNNSNIRAIFLVQVGYNDFDHMLPVIYKLANDSQLNYVIDVIFDTRSVFFSRDDHRLIFLHSLPNVRIHNTFPLDRYLNVYHILSRFNNKVSRILCGLLRRYIKWIYHDPNKIDWISLLGESIHCEQNCIIFCGMVKTRTNIIFSLLKDINLEIKTVLLPHGTELYSINQMIEPNDLSPVKHFRDYSEWFYLDYIFLCDYYSKDNAVKSGVEKNRIKVVGSARFCLEWIMESKKLGINGPIPEFGLNKIKVLFLFPHYATNIFMDEVYRTLLFLSQYPEIFLIVQIRIGTGLMNMIPDHLRNHPAINWIDDEFTTAALIDWSEVLIHSTSTMQYDGYQKKKIVIFPRYLLASSTLCEKYNAGIILKNRAELRDNINKMVESFEDFKKEYLKNSSGINDYINDYINPDDHTPVLEKYLHEIKTIIN